MELETYLQRDPTALAQASHIQLAVPQGGGMNMRAGLWSHFWSVGQN